MDVSKGNNDYTERDEQKILQEFRRVLQDILEPHHDDYYLYRYLKARDFDIFKAEKMIRETVKFRKRMNASPLLTAPYELPKVVQNHLVTFSIGCDKDYNQVRVFMLGVCDCKGFVNSLRTVDILKATMFLLDSEIKIMQEKRKEIPTLDERITFILDFTGFSLRKCYSSEVIRTATEMITMYQDHYPETLKTAYLINVPSYFNWIFNIFKPFLHPVTLSKIKVFRENYQQELLKVIDPKIIPAFMGGDFTDPDGNPKCLTLVTWDYKIDPSYYLKDIQQQSYSVDSSFISNTIRPRSTLRLPVEVTIADSVLKWNFRTKDYSIRFGLFYKADKNGSRMEEIFPAEGVESHIIPEENDFCCERVGTYILHFDNSYSWFTSKKIWYKVEINLV